VEKINYIPTDRYDELEQKKMGRCSENKALETNSDKKTSSIMAQISSNFFSFKSIKKGLKCSHFNLLIRSDVTCGVLSVPQQ